MNRKQISFLVLFIIGILFILIYMGFKHEDDRTKVESHKVQNRSVEILNEMETVNIKLDFMSKHLPLGIQYYRPKVNTKDTKELDEPTEPISRFYAALKSNDVDVFMSAFTANVITDFFKDKDTEKERTDAITTAISKITQNSTLKEMKIKIISDESMELQFIYTDNSSYKRKIKLTMQTGNNVDDVYQIETPINKLYK